MEFNVGELTSISLDLGQRRSLGRQLHQQLRARILSGNLPPGTRLLSSRALAEELGIARNTVGEALSQLVAEGYLEARAGAGTFVSRTLPQRAAFPVGGGGDLPERTVLSARGAAILRGSLAMSVRRPAFTPGLPAAEAFPYKTWSACAATVARGTRNQVDHGDPRGEAPLRSAVAAYLMAARGVRCRDEQIFIVAGAQDGMELLCHALLDPGDEAIVEEPAYSGLKTTLAAKGAVIRPVSVDAEGLVVPVDAGQWSSAKLICVTPSHQFPLGTTMTPGRRLRLLEAARDMGFWILEDDYDSEFRHLGNPLPALQGADLDGRVIHLGSFSKMLFPGLRLAYLVVPENLVDAMCRLRVALGARVPASTQLTLARFMQLGHLTRHIRAMRKLYRQRRTAFTQLLSQELSSHLTVTSNECGQHVVVELLDKARLDDKALARAGDARDLSLIPLSAFYEGEPRRQGFVLGFGALSDLEMRHAVSRLRRLMTTFPPAR